MDWRTDILTNQSDTLSDREKQLLTHGPDSLASSWRLSAMHIQWMRNHELTVNKNTEV